MPIEKVLCFVTSVALVAGAVASLGPVMWRYGKRVVVRVQSGHRWDAWCTDGRRIAEDGDPVGWLTIPSCGIDAIVLAGGSKSNLEESICLQSVELPDDQRLRVLSGHRDTHFRRLRHIKPGCELSIASVDGSTARYRVADLEVVPREALAEYLVARPRPGWIALLTCFPFRYVGSAPERLVVWASPR